MIYTERNLHPLVRLWTRITIMSNGCFIMNGATTNGGYVPFRIGRKLYKAHRWLWINTYGKISTGLELDHLCRNPRCCNLKHLEPVTHLENMRRGFWATKTHCLRGHPFTKENTWHSPSKPIRRWCKSCFRIRALRKTC